MNLPFFISRRYFFSKKKKNFINVIAIISMLVVSIGTAALIIVLSVVNGMEGLLRSIYGEFDAPIKIIPIESKSFVPTEALFQKINSVDGISHIIEVIEDNALLKYNNSQMIVKVKGLSDNFIEQKRMQGAVREGSYGLKENDQFYGLVGRGIQYKLGIILKNDFSTLQFFYPKDVKPGMVDPSQYYSSANIRPGGVFALEQYYDDNYVFVPIAFTEQLFGYKSKRNALELILTKEADFDDVQNQLQEIIGEDFNVLNADQQHADLYKILKMEKVFVFIIFSLIVAIASINIFFSLSMLVIEKKSDINMLLAMGSTKKLIRKIFMFEGSIIAILGSGSGLIIGFVFVFLQKEYGFISMNVESAVMSAYPVDIVAKDFVYTALTIVLITFLASIQPALRASRQSVLSIK